MNTEHFCIWLMAFLFLCGIGSIVSSLVDIKKEIQNFRYKESNNIEKSIIKLCNIQQNFCVFLMEYLRDKK